MLRKLDRWIGRHMSAKRWMVCWVCVIAGSMAGIYALLPSWWSIACLPTLIIGVIMFVANAERRMK